MDDYQEKIQTAEKVRLNYAKVCKNDYRTNLNISLDA